MINIHKGVSGHGRYICLETLSFEYPFSLVEVTYSLSNKDNKVKYARVGYNSHGRIIVKTKTPFPKWVKAEIRSNFLWGMDENGFVLKWNEIISNT